LIGLLLVLAPDFALPEETFLMSHPAVHQAFVGGVPDQVTKEAAVERG
jgi:hypothetical protein